MCMVGWACKQAIFKLINKKTKVCYFLIHIFIYLPNWMTHLQCASYIFKCVHKLNLLSPQSINSWKDLTLLVIKRPSDYFWKFIQNSSLTLISANQMITHLFKMSVLSWSIIAKTKIISILIWHHQTN